VRFTAALKRNVSRHHSEADALAVCTARVQQRTRGAVVGKRSGNWGEMKRSQWRLVSDGVRVNVVW
jgi:hypothetical protein